MTRHDTTYIIYLLTAIGLTPGVSSTVHIYTQTVHRTTQLTTLIGSLSEIRAQNVHINVSKTEVGLGIGNVN